MAKDKATPPRWKISKKAQRRIRLSSLKGSIAHMQSCLDNIARTVDRLAELEGRNER